MEFNASEILQLAETIWSATLSLPIVPTATDAPPTGPRSRAACVQITGAWKGAVLLDCPAPVARKAAAIMFRAEPATVSVTDMQDAVAELVNIVGGNFKALLPQPCHLSLPAVVEGGDYSVRIPGSRLMSRVEFSCEGDTVSISILEKVENQAAAA